MIPFANLFQRYWRGDNYAQVNTKKIYVEKSEPNIAVNEICTSELHSTVTTSTVCTPVVPFPHVPPLSIPPQFETDADACSVDSDPHELPVLPKKISSKIPFDKQCNIDLIIDEVVGLPVTTTATRISVKMVMPTKEIVGPESPFEYCDIASEYSCPTFKFKHQWKGRILHPTITIVCIVETLESLTLLPRTVGIAVLRLCVDNVGLQPISEVFYDDRPSCYFNTGQFLVPLLYGEVTDDIQFISEAKVQEQLLHIEGAFVRIGLVVARPGDAVIDHPFPSNINREYSVATSVKTEGNSDKRNSMDVLHFNSTTVATVLWRTYLSLVKHNPSVFHESSNNNSGANSYHAFGSSALSLSSASHSGRSTCGLNTTKLAIPAGVLMRFQHGEILHDQDRETVLQELQHYIIKSFHMNSDLRDSVSYSLHSTSAGGGGLVHGLMHSNASSHHLLTPNNPLVQSQYLVEYQDYSGALIGLDMLHNMPDRKALIDAAQSAASIAAIQSGLAREWDDRIIAFKTIFRYLPGSTFESNNDRIPDAPSRSISRAPSARRPQDENNRSFYNLSFRSSSAVQEKQEVIVDDASVKPYLFSNELSPAYTDDYSSTAGMKLGPYACVLIVVTAVDILTRHPVNLQEEMQEEVHVPNMPLSPTHSKGFMSPAVLNSNSVDNNSIHSYTRGEGVGTGTGTSAGLTTNTMGTGLGVSSSSTKESLSKKLRGLLGIYVGHNDPRATWWGLVPIFKTLPHHLLPGLPGQPSPSGSPPATNKAGKADAALSARSNRLRSPHLGDAVGSIFTSGSRSALGAKTYHQVSTVVEREASVGSGLSSNAPEPQILPSLSTNSELVQSNTADQGVPGHRPTNLTIETSASSNAVGSSNCIPTSTCSINSWPLFVNDGTHQIPLFEGLPPEDMLSSLDPMLWVVNQLDAQVNQNRFLISSNGSGSSRSRSSSSYGLGSASASFMSLVSPLFSFFSSSSPASKKRKKRKKRKSKMEENYLTLSPGSSVIVRLANPRMKKLAPLPIVDNREKVILRHTLEYLFKIYAQQPNRTASTNTNSENENYQIVNREVLRLLNSIVTDNSKLKVLKQQFAFAPNHNLFNNHYHHHSLTIHNMGMSMMMNVQSSLNLGSASTTPSGGRLGGQHRFNNKRTLDVLMNQEGLDAAELVLQINQKFYETLSS